jgi:hypothetical protein
MWYLSWPKRHWSRFSPSTRFPLPLIPLTAPHSSHTTSGTGTIGQTVADIPNEQSDWPQKTQTMLQLPSSLPTSPHRYCCCYWNRNRDSDWLLAWWPGFHSRRKEQSFVWYVASLRSFGLIHHPIQWVPRGYFPEANAVRAWRWPLISI